MTGVQTCALPIFDDPDFPALGVLFKLASSFLQQLFFAFLATSPLELELLSTFPQVRFFFYPHFVTPFMC